MSNISEEEKIVIEELKNLIEKARELREEEFYSIFTIHEVQNIATVLNIIEKQNKEIEIKDKMIDEIITYLFNLTGFRLLIKENGFCEKIKKCINDDQKCFKEYFRKKVEND